MVNLNKAPTFRSADQFRRFLGKPINNWDRSTWSSPSLELQELSPEQITDAFRTGLKLKPGTRKIIISANNGDDLLQILKTLAKHINPGDRAKLSIVVQGSLNERGLLEAYRQLVPQITFDKLKTTAVDRTKAVFVTMANPLIWLGNLISKIPESINLQNLDPNLVHLATGYLSGFYRSEKMTIQTEAFKNNRNNQIGSSLRDLVGRFSITTSPSFIKTWENFVNQGSQAGDLIAVGLIPVWVSDDSLETHHAHPSEFIQVTQDDITYIPENAKDKKLLSLTPGWSLKFLIDPAIVGQVLDSEPQATIYTRTKAALGLLASPLVWFGTLIGKNTENIDSDLEQIIFLETEAFKSYDRDKLKSHIEGIMGEAGVNSSNELTEVLEDFSRSNYVKVEKLRDVGLIPVWYYEATGLNKDVDSAFNISIDQNDIYSAPPFGVRDYLSWHEGRSLKFLIDPELAASGPVRKVIQLPKTGYELRENYENRLRKEGLDPDGYIMNFQKTSPTVTDFFYAIVRDLQKRDMLDKKFEVLQNFPVGWDMFDLSSKLQYRELDSFFQFIIDPRKC